MNTYKPRSGGAQGHLQSHHLRRRPGGGRRRAGGLGGHALPAGLRCRCFRSWGTTGVGRSERSGRVSAGSLPGSRLPGLPWRRASSCPYGWPWPSEDRQPRQRLGHVVSMVLILLVVVWLLSALFGYWDARKSRFPDPAGLRLLLARVHRAFSLGRAWHASQGSPGGGPVLRARVDRPAMAQDNRRRVGDMGIFTFFAFDMYEAFSRA